MYKIIVTGGAGYIGSHTVVELYNSGFEPIIIDNLCNSSIKNIHGIEEIINKKITLHKIDCTKKNFIKDILNDKNIIGVIHFAAFKSVEESVLNPEKYYKNNIDSLKVILELMEEINLNNIIFSSSCTVYGQPSKLPVKESSPFKKAESPYGETKQICEKILKEKNLNSICLRYFNPIGSHKSSLIGDCSNDKPSNLVPIITEVAIGKRKSMKIFGNNYNTHDGTCIRDYIHVVDLAKAHVKSLQYLLKKPGKHVFNVGTGKGISVLELIKSFEKKNKLSINYQIGERRAGDIEQIYSDNSLISKLIGWEAKESIEQALLDAWNWEKSKNNEKKS